MTSSLASLIKTVPKTNDLKAARQRLAALQDKAAQDDLSPHLQQVFDAHPIIVDLMLGIASQSPYLWRLALQNPARLIRILKENPDERFDAIITECLGSSELYTGDEAALMRALRLAKQEAALLIALADLGGVWTVERVTEALSKLADTALQSALNFVTQEEIARGKLVAPENRDEPPQCGLVILALGKHGAGELNYSSDIDIVVLYDPDRAPLADGVDAGPLFVRMVKAIVRLVDQRTSDGYVFRVDLRLRPDPASTPVAISVASAFAYYESVGQNWERAALIKARPVAGDLAVGEEFLVDLVPFIWRKYFDFAAIADIHAMKRQIHAVRGHEAIAVAGHDIKLGRGGIREVEFFVQTQQLVFGGRRPALRGRRTLDMLVALQADGWISTEARDDLTKAYRFLRGLEHRLQMVADEQTQRLPADEEELKRFSRFCGYAGIDAFSKALTGMARLVERHYARLF